MRRLIETFNTTWINPFADGTQNLVSISTGRVASEEIERDLVDAHKTGLEAYKAFREERLEKSTKTFHKPLQKQKLKTFTNLSKKDKLCKAGPKEIILKADRNLFAHNYDHHSSEQTASDAIGSWPLPRLHSLGIRYH